MRVNREVKHIMLKRSLRGRRWPGLRTWPSKRSRYYCTNTGKYTQIVFRQTYDISNTGTFTHMIFRQTYDIKNTGKYTHITYYILGKHITYYKHRNVHTYGVKANI